MHGKVALVTGGNSGIGRGIAHRFAREGATVIIAGRDAAKGGKVMAELRELGTEAAFFAIDLADEAAVQALTGDIDARFGRQHFELLRLAASDPRVARIFVHPVIKQALCEQDWPDRTFLRTVRPWYGHEDHMHVRLHCPSGSTDCVAQAPPAAGDGCGAEIDGWLDRGPLPRRPPGVRREPVLPPRCEALRQPEN